MSIKKSELKIDTTGKPFNAYLASPSGGGPGILVLPSWWGLKPFFKQVCDQLAESGYTALAPDYYGGRVGHTIEETRALQEEAEGDFEAMKAMIAAARDHLLSLRPGRPIGIAGFSMGTDWALITAASDPEVAATVLFYGGWSTDFSRMKSRVLVQYAGMDEWFPLDKMTAMEQDMRAAGVDVTVHVYPEAAHWFMEADRPEYDPQAAQLAWSRTYEFLKQDLK